MTWLNVVCVTVPLQTVIPLYLLLFLTVYMCIVLFSRAYNIVTRRPYNALLA